MGGDGPQDRGAGAADALVVRRHALARALGDRDERAGGRDQWSHEDTKGSVGKPSQRVSDVVGARIASLHDNHGSGDETKVEEEIVGGLLVSQRFKLFQAVINYKSI